MEICTKYEHVIITGDFNINTFDTNKIKLIGQLMNELFMYNDQCPTYSVRNFKPSQIDLIFSKVKYRIISFDHFDASGISNHQMLNVQYNILPNKKCHEEFSFRSFNKADIDDINKTASMINWNILYRNYNVNEKTQHFISTISNLFNEKIPLQNIKLKNTPVPWMNNDILNAMNCRNNFYKMFKINEQQSFKEIAYKCYKDSNKVVKKMINKAKKENFEQSYYNSPDNKSRWRLIHSIGITKKSRKSFNNNSLSNITAESLHQYFLRNNTVLFIKKQYTQFHTK